MHATSNFRKMVICRHKINLAFQLASLKARSINHHCTSDVTHIDQSIVFLSYVVYFNINK